MARHLELFIPKLQWCLFAFAREIQYFFRPNHYFPNYVETFFLSYSLFVVILENTLYTSGRRQSSALPLLPSLLSSYLTLSFPSVIVHLLLIAVSITLLMQHSICLQFAVSYFSIVFTASSVNTYFISWFSSSWFFTSNVLRIL